jgi:adenine/guanine phosphoribosyltransferase-like PRPP-binding protein
MSSTRPPTSSPRQTSNNYVLISGAWHCRHGGAGAKAFIVDDVLATGGTGVAAYKLLADVGADVIGFAVLLELEALGGRERLAPVPVHALLSL